MILIYTKNDCETIEDFLNYRDKYTLIIFELCRSLIILLKS